MADESLGVVTPEVPTPVAAPEATPAPEIPADQESETPEGAEPVKPEKTYSQKEMEQAISDRLTKETRRLSKIARAEAERDLYKQQLETLQRPQQQTQPPSGEPRPDQFKDWESFNAALIDYRVEQRLGKFRQESEAQQHAREAQEQARSVQERLKPAESKYPDFREVALSEDVPITQPMAAFIASRDTGGDVAYFLGSNLDEATRISRLHPVDQVLALRDLETKLNAAPAPTRTPAPIRPNQGNASAGKSLADLIGGSQEDFEKKRAAFLARKR